MQILKRDTPEFTKLREMEKTIITDFQELRRNSDFARAEITNTQILACYFEVSNYLID